MEGQGEVWERAKGESPVAYQAFERYRDMGADRSAAKVGRSLGKSTDIMDRWSKRWFWVERAQAWDAHQSSIAIEAVERATADRAEMWAMERTAHRDRELDLGKALLAKAQEMLAFPLFTTREESIDGEMVTIIEPGRWRLADAAKMVEVGSKLVRLAADMELDRVVIKRDAKELAAEFGLPLDEVEAEYKRILAERS